MFIGWGLVARGRHAAANAVACALLLLMHVACAQERQVFTPRAMFETRRPMTSAAGEGVFVSPGGKRYAIMLIEGDVSRDGVWADIRVGELGSAQLTAPRPVARLFTHARGGGYLRKQGSEVLSWPQRNVPRWRDESHLEFLWENDAGLRQVLEVDVESGERRWLTQHATDVMHFTTTESGALAYGAQVPCEVHPTVEEREHGYVVEASDAFALVYGCGAWERDGQALYVKGSNASQVQRVTFEGGDSVSRSPPLFPSVLFSPREDRALYVTSVSTIPPEWQRYTAPHFRDMLAAHVGEGASGPYGSQFQQLFVIDVDRAKARPLWNVPNEPYARLRAAWSPDGRAVVLGPTFAPAAQADAQGLASEAVGIVRVSDGAFEALPVPIETVRGLQALRWENAERITLVTAQGCWVLRKHHDRWQTPQNGECVHPDAKGRFRVAWEESISEAPCLMGIDEESDNRVLLLDPNPDLAKRFSLGRVEWIDREIDGVRWQGRLYYPAVYRSAQRYPLVVQTHLNAGRIEYSVTGRGGSSPALGPSMSAYLAQPLASAGIFVLHGNAQVSPSMSLLEQTRLRIRVTEVLVRELIERGWVQADRVGLMGYSASGWDVTYALTHPSFAYAAALTDDNKDGTYLQAAVSNWVFGLGEEMIGARAFGSGLKQWLAESPSFNVEQVRAPLLMTVSAPGSELGRWELFSRLRARHRPVEWYVIPDLEHGSHGLQNPTQLLALQERALDWWKFWLKDEIDGDRCKASQYARWKLLRAQRDALISNE